LRERHLEGRLDNDEFQSRLERCLAAKTYAELDELIADFPSEETEERGPRIAWTRRPWPLVLPLALIAAIVLSHGRALWLVFPLMFFFVIRRFVWRSWGGYPDRTWACGPRRVTRV
jgi:hypothetical protein